MHAVQNFQLMVLDPLSVDNEIKVVLNIVHNIFANLFDKF